LAALAAEFVIFGNGIPTIRTALGRHGLLRTSGGRGGNGWTLRRHWLAEGHLAERAPARVEAGQCIATWTNQADGHSIDAILPLSHRLSSLLLASTAERSSILP